MSAIEKLVKSFEALKVLHTTVDKPEEALVSTKFIKKEVSITKKDKINHCHYIADIIVLPQLRTIDEFHKFLGIAIETFLACCDDNDSDVRLAANECLNKTVKSLVDCQLGRIQVEFYKEIKKNGSSRSVRASFSRFADLCRLIKVSKRRPYFVNIVPCIIQLSQLTEDESLQDTLGVAVPKIMSAFGLSATDSELRSLIDAFLPNLRYVLPCVRRTATVALVSICQYSKQPAVFCSLVLRSLLKLVNNSPGMQNPMHQEQAKSATLCGVFGCFKHMVPLLSCVDKDDTETSVALGIYALTETKQKESLPKETESLIESTLHIYELILHSLRHASESSVTLAALEALNQLLKSPPHLILSILISPNGITKSRLGQDMKLSVPSSPCMSLRNMKVGSSVSSSMDVTALEEMEELNTKSSTICNKDINLSFKQDLSQTAGDSSSRDLSTPDEILVSEDKNDHCFLNEFFNHGTPIKSNGKFNLNKLAFVESEEMSDHFSPSTPIGGSEAGMIHVADIGEFTSCNMSSLEYCTRLVCSHFLLAGSKKSLISDKLVKVSIKSFALSSLSNILKFYPRCFVIDLVLNAGPNEPVQKVWDVVLYSAHSDPHLRGQVCLVIANFVKQVLETSLCYNDFLLKNCSPSAFAEAPTLEELIFTHLFRVLFEKEASSVCVRHGLNALQISLSAMMLSNEVVNAATLQILERILELRKHAYWLVKVELLEVFPHIPFAAVFHLQKRVSNNFPANYCHNQGLQQYIINELYIPLLSDEDHRVRQAASNSLVQMIPRLHQPLSSSSNDAVTALAERFMGENIGCFAHGKYSMCNMSTNHFTSSTLDFQFPFAAPCKEVADASVSSNLKTIIQVLIDDLLVGLDNKNRVVGLCQALSDLSDAYPTTTYATAWGCEHNANTNSIQCVKVLLSLLMDHPWFTVDLGAHQTTLHFIGNLLSGLCHSVVKNSAQKKFEDVEDFEWGIIGKESRDLSSLLESFTEHIFKILNLHTSIVEDIPSTASSSNSSSVSSSKSTVIPSLTSSSLSPIRRRTFKSEADKTESGRKTGNDKEKDKMKKVLVRQSSFVNHPLTSRLSETMKSIYNSSKISLEMSRNKLSILLETSLQCFCQVLEVGTSKFFEKHAEELLYYLQSLVGIEPLPSVNCVLQLLKCVFGNNFQAKVIACFERENDDVLKSEAVTKLNQTYSIPDMASCGLYRVCIAAPYANFSHYRAKICQEDSSLLNETTSRCFLHRLAERKLSSALDKPVTPTSSKLALTNSIRLFEPIVIKVLKLYTVTSDADFQREALYLICHLVKLRVNYCLLDSEKVFFGFVEKQFEYVEKREMMGQSRLINQMFQFFVLLSYERYHSQPIIEFSRILQMFDQLKACGQSPDDCLIPAVIPLADDLFLSRGPSRVDSVKEVEAQKEVVLSKLLQFITYKEIMETLFSVICQVRRESEDKWKKLSRQVMDTILPLLVKQQIRVKDCGSLDALHALFDSLSTTVFHPVDYLLKALFSLQAANDDALDCNFNSWLTSVLTVIRVLAIHVKEEVVLTRLDELCFSNSSSTLNFSHENELDFTNRNVTSPERVLIDFIFGLVKKVALQIEKIVCRSHPCAKDKDLLLQQSSHLMLYLTHMFQSGSYRRLARYAADLVRSEDNSDIDTINSVFATVDIHMPTLLIQWCNILMLLSFDDNGTHDFWYNLLKRTSVGAAETPDESFKEHFNSLDTKPYPAVLSVRYEILRKGVVILLCDFLSENMSDVEQLTWLIINNIRDLIMYSNEIPVRDFIQTVHRNQASSGLFLQAIMTRCEDVNEPYFLRRLIQCVEFSHDSQSASLVVLLVNHVLLKSDVCGFISCSIEARNLALSRMRYLLQPERQCEDDHGLSLEEVKRLLGLLEAKKEHELVAALMDYRKLLKEESDAAHPLTVETATEKCDKDWFISFVSKYCKHKHHYKFVAPFLLSLSFEELSTILNENRNPVVWSELIEASSGVIELNSEKSVLGVNVFAAPRNRNMLMKIVVNSTLTKLNHICSHLPEPHFPFVSDPELLSPKEEKHRDALVHLFLDSSFTDAVYSFGPVYVSIIKHAEFSRCFTLNPDIIKSMTRVGVLYAEMAHFQIERSFVEHATLFVNVIDAFLSCDTLVDKLAVAENVTYLCSVVAAVHALCEYFTGPLEKVGVPNAFQEAGNLMPEFKHTHDACVRTAQLLSQLEKLEKIWNTSAPYVIKSSFCRTILSLARISTVNCIAIIPPATWRQNLWSPDFSGEFATVCPVIPSELLLDTDILQHFIFRIKAIGWRNRLQFEEIWMSLFGVVAIIQNEDAPSVEEQTERVLTACLAINGITSLLLQALLHPVAGNPLKSSYLRVEHTKLAPFLATKYGEKLKKVRDIIGQTSKTSTAFTDSQKTFQFGSISVEYIRQQIGGQSGQDISPSLSSSSLSTSSSSSVTASPSKGAKQYEGSPAVVTEALRYRQSLDIDINSCIYFLLELYGQLVNSVHTQPPLLVELCKSVSYLSDLFFDRAQYEWMLETWLELFKLAVASEDEIILQFLGLGVCKAAAVLAIDQEQQIEKCKKFVEVSLKSSFLPTRINTLYGLRYLLEKPNTLPNGKETLFLPLISDYVLKHLSEPQLPSSHNTEHYLLIWKFAFHLIEFFVDDFNESEFAKKIFQIALKLLESGEGTSLDTLQTISNGLERLLVCEVFSVKDVNIVIKAATNRIKTASSKIESVIAINVLVTALYICKYNYKKDSASVSTEKFDNTDELLSTMEKFGVLFDRLRNCTSTEAETICSILPSMLNEFFPTQEVLNKIIGEFLSSQQSNRKHVASIIYEVFGLLHNQGLHSVVQNWVSLSLSSFTQIAPKSLGLWTLLCFLISASSNEWVHSCFACVKERIDNIDTIDEKLFETVCSSFCEELTEDEDKTVFLSTLESAATSSDLYAKITSSLRNNNPPLL